ncbi:MAG: Maf family nucleotide pyrophosphatase [Luteimonas sp.]
MPRLLLASTSPYRRELLARLRLPFELAHPDTDETALAGESPTAMVQRLAAAKAAGVARLHPGAWVLGSDQVAEFEGAALGKPGTRERAMAQLLAMSGHEVAFHTGVCLAHSAQTGFQALDTTLVRFRRLDAAVVARYVDAEQPFDCAGSFKAEGLGIALFESIQSQDPTALVGLPLIATAGLLRAAGFLVP